MGMVFGEFPMGWLMDRRGARFGLTFAVMWWSIANALHAVANSLLHFSFFRFWLGTGECGNFSGGNKVVAQWFPVRERAFAVGIFNSASMIGSAVAPFLIVPIMHWYGWRVAFLVPSLLGMVWAAVWWFFYRSPEEHKGLSAAEAAYIRDGEPAAAGPTPTNAQLLRLGPTWGLMLCRLLVGPVVQFYIYWLPEYLYRARGFSLTEIAFFAWIPFLFGDLGSIGGGWASGFLIRRGYSVRAARIITMGFGAALCFLSLAVVLVKTVPVALIAICCVLFGHTRPVGQHVRGGLGSLPEFRRGAGDRTDRDRRRPERHAVPAAHGHAGGPHLVRARVRHGLADAGGRAARPGGVRRQVQADALQVSP